MMRDKRKSAEYFDEYIAYQKKRIDRKENKLQVSLDDKAKCERINLSLITYKVNLVIAEYSAGYSLRIIRKTVDDALDTIIEMEKPGFEPVLNLLAFQVALDDHYRINELMNKHGEMISKDKLLNCFATFIKTQEFVWKGTFTVTGVFDQLDQVVGSRTPEEALNTYLESWYENHADAAWYESDKNKNDVYVGYWSFESAALARILNLNEDILSKNIYYPIF